MKKISWVLMIPVILNVVTFTKRFMYDSILMFFISFMVFFVSLYADSEGSSAGRKRWNAAAAVMMYMSLALFMTNSASVSFVLLLTALVPAVVGTAVFLIYKLRTASGSKLAGTVNG